MLFSMKLGCEPYFWGPQLSLALCRTKIQHRIEQSDSSLGEQHKTFWSSVIVRPLLCLFVGGLLYFWHMYVMSYCLFCWIVTPIQMMPFWDCKPYFDYTYEAYFYFQCIYAYIYIMLLSNLLLSNLTIYTYY